MIINFCSWHPLNLWNSRKICNCKRRQKKKTIFALKVFFFDKKFKSSKGFFFHSLVAGFFIKKKLFEVIAWLFSWYVENAKKKHCETTDQKKQTSEQTDMED